MRGGATLSPATTAWVLTDCKPGDENLCIGLVEALGLRPDLRRVAPRPIFALLAPRGPIDPRDAPSRPGSPLAPPFPDLAVASGRRAVPYLRALKRASHRQVFTVFLRDPRVGGDVADLIWVATHDRLRGPDVLVTDLAPHRVSPAALARERAQPDPRLVSLPRPRAAVLVGGDSRHHRFAPDDVQRLLGQLDALARSGVSLMITVSRRTPAVLSEGLRRLAAERCGYMWSGEGRNPYMALLALADAIVVTADSTNMVGEAAATGAPILLFEPSGGADKITRFLDSLRRQGALTAFRGQLEGGRYDPLDTTSEIANIVADRFRRHRAMFRPEAPD